MAYDAARATRDLDAVFVPTDVVRQAARAVAERRGLTEGWLNDAVKGFLPGPDPDAQRFYSSDSLIVDVAVASRNGRRRSGAANAVAYPPGHIEGRPRTGS